VAERLTRRFHVPSAVRRSPLRIDPAEARALVAGGALLVDVRRRDDRIGVLEDAVRIPPDEIPGKLTGFRRDHPIILACT
jgi:hypothetical protein